MRTFLAIVVGIAAAASATAAAFDYKYDATQNRWDLNNGTVTAVFELTQSGYFQIDQIGLPGQPWSAPAAGHTSPIRFALNDQIFDSSTQYTLLEQHTETTTRNGMRQVITLLDSQALAKVQVHIDLFRGQPVVRFRTLVTNLSVDTAFVTMSDMLPVILSGGVGPFRVFRVNQWTVEPKNSDFESLQTTLTSSVPLVSIRTGSHGAQASWIAVRDSKNLGVFAGWEFNGRSNAWIRQPAGQSALQFSAPVDALHHPLPGGGTFVAPAAFLGFFSGDWDEAGYRTQRFVEASLARPAPDLQRFPYMSWDSWGFQEQFDEQVLRNNADIAASLGVELFIVDLGWARNIGDWHEDPAKFPSGLKALSDYVHGLGMRFGLHLTPAEAALDSPVLTGNPDWTSTEIDGYFNALSLCLSHTPVRNWVVNEIIRVIDDYGVDWILQDGENMVKSCNKTTHTHDPDDSNYANSSQGIDYVVEEVLRQRPNVSWENCENGGNMMTFKMVQNYVTSITNDASGALGSRQGAYGATFPFSPRFADRYSPEDPVSSYNTRSYMFGGPWHLMNRLDTLGSVQLDFAASEIAAYKQMRGHIRDGKVYHLAAPAEGAIDVIESSHLSNQVIAIVTRNNSDANSYLLKLRGVAGAAVYDVHFQTDPRTLRMTGLQLANEGLLVNLPDARSSEIVYATRQ